MEEIKFKDGVIDFNEWKASGKDWRERLEKERKRLRSQFDTREYERQDLSWFHTAFLEYFLFAYDTSVYDRESGCYRIEELLDQGKTEFGGYDFIDLWPGYPRLGVDERNQFDFFRDMPGGFEGLKDLVRRAHRKGVRVFIPYLPWDKGTRREEKSDIEMLAEIAGKLDADGIVVDSSSAAPSGLRQVLDKVKPGVVFSPENYPRSMRFAEICTGSLLPFGTRLNFLPIKLLLYMLSQIGGNLIEHNQLAQLPQLDREIEVFLNNPTTETLYLSDFFFWFFEKRQNSDESM